MRLASVLIVTLACGCNDGVAPPLLENNDMGIPDQGPEDAAMAGEDLAGAVDLLASDALPGNVDMVPAGCSTACDCPAGQHCENGACTSRMPMVFCCGAATCPSSQICETPMKTVSQCGNPDAGLPPDLGSTTCAGITCIPGPGSTAFCTVLCGASATCKTTGGGSHCSP